MTNALQALLDGMSGEWQRERAATQMTLGKLIAALEALPGNRLVLGFGDPMSYRGYYEDLAFAPNADTRTVADLLAHCRRCMGHVFEGYKGGEFVMGANTALWIAEYGDSGPRLMGLDTAAKPILPIVAPADD